MISIFDEHLISLVERFSQQAVPDEISILDNFENAAKTTIKNLLNVFKHFLGVTPYLLKFLRLLCFSCNIYQLYSKI